VQGATPAADVGETVLRSWRHQDKGLSLNNRNGWWRGDPFTHPRLSLLRSTRRGWRACAPMTRWASMARYVKRLSGVGP
jgi:hypothetical protein